MRSGCAGQNQAFLPLTGEEKKNPGTTDTVGRCRVHTTVSVVRGVFTLSG